MVKDLFETLLEEAGQVLQIPTLHPDRNNSCLIKLMNGVSVQIEMDAYQQAIVMGSDLGGLPTGRYRENVFREALKSNGVHEIHHGILAYSSKSDHMVLFEILPLKDLNGERIADALNPFSEKAERWKNALEHGEVPTMSNIRSSTGMFGLRP